MEGEKQKRDRFLKEQKNLHRKNAQTHKESQREFNERMNARLFRDWTPSDWDNEISKIREECEIRKMSPPVDVPACKTRKRNPPVDVPACKTRKRNPSVDVTACKMRKRSPPVDVPASSIDDVSASSIVDVPVSSIEGGVPASSSGDGGRVRLSQVDERDLDRWLCGIHGQPSSPLPDSFQLDGLFSSEGGEFDSSSLLSPKKCCFCGSSLCIGDC
jgi:hypothetical protein